MEPIQVLRQAADVIRERGWHQGQYVSAAHGGVCIEGAIHVVLTGDPRDCPWSPCFAAQEVLRGYLGLYVQEALGPAFNDSPSTTQDEVLEALEHAGSDPQ